MESLGSRVTISVAWEKSLESPMSEASTIDSIPIFRNKRPDIPPLDLSHIDDFRSINRKKKKLTNFATELNSGKAKKAIIVNEDVDLGANTGGCVSHICKIPQGLFDVFCKCVCNFSCCCCEKAANSQTITASKPAKDLTGTHVAESVNQSTHGGCGLESYCPECSQQSTIKKDENHSTMSQKTSQLLAVKHTGHLPHQSTASTVVT
eukprot:Platyproteum_vivax@DN6829_c0_g1_i1.p1